MSTLVLLGLAAWLGAWGLLGLVALVALRLPAETLERWRVWWALRRHA